MTCGYCGSRRYIGEPRCRICGCRSDDTLTGEFPAPFTDGALATQPRPALREARSNVQPIARRAQAAAAAPAAAPRQGPLFEDQLTPKVVSISPNRQRSRPVTATRNRRPAPELMQGRLDLDAPPPPARKTLSTTVEARIYCEYPVATTIHRAIAAALDWSMVLIGYGLFLLVFHLLGGNFALENKVNIGMFLGMLALLGLAYALLWTVVARGDTAGTRWAQLRITTFDGDRPDPRQRFCRLAGSCLSLCTVVGLLWSFADEESLTWQDHISSTFPTPVPLGSSRRS